MPYFLWVLNESYICKRIPNKKNSNWNHLNLWCKKFVIQNKSVCIQPESRWVEWCGLLKGSFGINLNSLISNKSFYLYIYRLKPSPRVECQQYRKSNPERVDLGPQKLKKLKFCIFDFKVKYAFGFKALFELPK